MNTSLCEQCLWGDNCSAGLITCGHHTPLIEPAPEYEADLTDYTYEWNTYIHCWQSNDKWGDTYDR